MTHSSAIEFATGVAVAKVTTRGPWRAAQRPQLDVEVLGALRAGAGDAVDRGVDPPVLVGVGLVDEEVVDAGLLEPDAVVLGVLGEEPLVGLLQLGDAAFEPLDRQALAVLRSGERARGPSRSPRRGRRASGRAPSGRRANPDWVKTMPSQSPVAARATNSLRRSLESRSRSATRIRAVG